MEHDTLRRALTIAGFDPTGWAGVLADAGVYSDFGLGSAGVVTALTVQDLERVQEVRPVDALLLSAEIESALSSPLVSGVKIGMLGTGANVEAVADMIERHEPCLVVLDPVLGSTGGLPLLDKDGVKILRDRLLPLCTLVTPNLSEAATLTGREVNDIHSMREAAVIIYNELGPDAVLVKGGHLGTAPLDLLHDGTDFHELAGKRIHGPAGAFHGTGCLLSSAVTAGLVSGLGLHDAVERAKRYTEKILEKRIRLLGGH